MMIHIGSIIKKVVKQKGLTVTEFGKRISTHRRNVYDIFERESVDTALLQKISKALEHDFFNYYKTVNEKLSNLEESSTNYNADEKLIENITIYKKEIEYLKELVREKNKIISLLEKKVKKA